MKKKTVVLLCLAMLMTILAPPTFADDPTINVILDGQTLTFDVPPFIDNGRTMLPVRPVFEAMGATVSWDEATQNLSAVKGDTTVVVSVGSVSPTINGVVKTIDVPIKMVNGTVFAPLRFVCEAFGGTVSWDGSTYTVTIVSAVGSGGGGGGSSSTVSVPLPSVVIDGQVVTFADQAPILDNGELLVPLRAIFEAMGATVTWDAATMTATGVNGDITVVMAIGSVTPTVNGEIVNISVPAQVFNGRTMVPLKFVVEAFGGTISWAPATFTAYVVSNLPQPPQVAPAVAVDGVTIAPSALSLNVGGAAANVTATILPSDATYKTVTYKSNNPAVATVSLTGLVTPVAVGDATITATTTDGDKTAACEVTVNPAVTAISPTAGTISKNAPADTPIIITWGSAKAVTKMLASSPAFGLTYNPHEGVDYTVTDNGDGTGTFVIKKELANQLPVPISMVPTGAEMAITIQFDNGTSLDYTLIVVDGPSVARLSISPITCELKKNNVADIPIHITWGPATNITGITGSVFGDSVSLVLNKGSEYNVVDYRNGTGLLNLKCSSIATLLPMPLSDVPDGTILTLTINFDEGEKTFKLTIKDPLYVNAYSVAIDNSTNALPQSGLNDAEIIFETAVAPGVTRYLGVFDPYKDVEEIGPVRSARNSLIDIACGFKSAFAHCGGSSDALYRLPSEPLINLDEIYGSGQYFYRSSDRKAPHNLYTNSQLINDGIINKDAQTEVYSTPYTIGEMSGGEQSMSAIVKFYGQYHSTEFKWNSAKQQYEKYFNGNMLVLKDGNPIHANNVVVMYAKHKSDYVAYVNENVVQANLIGSGKAVFYRDGKRWTGTWTKNSDDENFTFAVDNETMCFSSGNTWVLIAEEDRSTELSNIKVGNGKITPDFSPDISNYTVKLPVSYTGTVPDVTVLSADPSATIRINKANSLTGLEAERTTTITVSSVKGNSKSYKVTFYVAKDYFSKTLIHGWNTLSIPLELDKKSFADIVDDVQKVKLAYVYDSGQSKWVEISPYYTFKPMDAICLKVDDITEVKLFPSKDFSGGYTRSLKGGWNFFGPALDLSLSPTAMTVRDALYSISGQFSQIISPGMGNQMAWGYAPSMNANPLMQAGEGYWIYLKQNASLAGYSYTPIKEIAENSNSSATTTITAGGGAGVSPGIISQSCTAFNIAESVDAEIPSLPAAFYGTVTDQNGNSLSEGTIEVVVNGVVQASKKFKDGKFGMSLGERLIVEKVLSSEVYKIEFIVNDYLAHANVPIEWESAFGELNSLQLKVDMSEPDEFVLQAVRPVNNTSVELIFSKSLEPSLINDATFKKAISISTNGTDYISLNPADDVSIKDNKLLITFSQALQGNQNQLKIAGNTLKDTGGTIIVDSVTTSAFSSGTIDECFIATAAFGSKFEPAVVLLRHFRDQYLLTNKLGTAFVGFYYHNSPPIAAYIAHSEPLKVFVRMLLIPIIAVAYSFMHPVMGGGCILVLCFILVFGKHRKKVINTPQ